MIRFTLELDATDALEQGDQTASALGIHPPLAAIELLAQPASDSGGSVPDSPGGGAGRAPSFTLFVWGSQRVLPLKFIQLIVRETLFDGKLNPFHAAVDVSLELLSPAELDTNPRAKAFMDLYLKQKEWLSQQPGSSGPTEDLLAAVNLINPPG